MTLTRAALARWRSLPADFRWFIGGLCLSAIGAGIVDPAFNNYLRDTFHLTAGQRGQIEFPREMPGFLVAVTSGMLFFLPEVRTAALSVGLIAMGFAGLAWAGTHYGIMIFFMVLWSTGMHLLMPMRASIILSFAKEGKQATLIGKIGSITTFASILGAGFTLWLFRRFTPSLQTYHVAFLLGAAMAAIGAVMLLQMRLPERHARTPRPKMVFNWRYRVYYALSILFGARKQIFITFAPWVLITVLGRGPSTFAALAMVGAPLGVIMQPLIGKLVDRFGERAVLMSDGVLLFGVCMGYGFAHRISSGGAVLLIVYACYLLDQLLFAVGMARTTYMYKIAEKPEDVTASLSLGVTLDHAVSMSIPTLGGAIWMLFGFEYVFLAAAGIALTSTVVASFIGPPERTAAQRSTAWPKPQPVRSSG